MEAPLLLALARARLLAGGGSVQSVWASQRALGLIWSPDRKVGIEPGLAWIFLLAPAPELWMLHEKSAAYSLLKAESKTALSRQWSAEIKGARLYDVQGDPRERRIGIELRRRAITGREERMRISFQAIPGRGGIRLDGIGLNTARIGLGTPFSAEQPEPVSDTPPMRKWREKWGENLESALQGQIADILPGEGQLLCRHKEWSLHRAEKLLLQPKKQAEERKYVREAQRLQRLGEALEKDRLRHQSMLSLREPAIKIQAELWRLKGAIQQAKLLDGTIIELPAGQRAEEAVQKWFSSVKKAERGLRRVATLERERLRQVLELETSAMPGAQPTMRNSQCTMHNKEKKKVEKTEANKRADGKGKAYRTLMIEGFELLIGKGDADNDNLTFRVAAPSDFWLHVAGMPGSHVIIRNPDKLSDLPRSVLERAAELAAFYSKARDGGKTEVHWCRVADVNKPRGYAPGKVILKSYKSLRVYPKE